MTEAQRIVLDAGDQGADIGPFYLVGYRSSVGDILHFTLGAANSARPDTIERIRVRGVEGELITTSGWPKLGISWQEGQRVYYVQTYGDEISREELLRIVDSLVPVEQNLATPTPSGPPPRSKWDSPVTGLYLLEHPEVMQASDKGIVLTVHYIIVERQYVAIVIKSEEECFQMTEVIGSHTFEAWFCPGVGIVTDKVGHRPMGMREMLRKYCVAASGVDRVALATPPTEAAPPATAQSP